jgi:hypothetical protein
MEDKQTPEEKFAEIKKRLEARGLKLIDVSDKIKAIGFIGGVGSHQNRNQSSPERGTENGTAANGN